LGESPVTIARCHWHDVSMGIDASVLLVSPGLLKKGVC
jgi:hypothetical protein